VAAPTLKPASATMPERIAELRLKRAKIEEGGGKQRIQKHHQAGKLTARERIDKLVDPPKLPGDWFIRQAPGHLLWHGRQGPSRRRSGHRMRHG